MCGKALPYRAEHLKPISNTSLKESVGKIEFLRVNSVISVSPC